MDADGFLTESERGEVRDAIEEAEDRTSAELVCAVATESDRYDRAESIAGLAFALIALGAAHAGMAYGSATSGSWAEVASPGFGVQVAIIVGGFVVGSILTSYWHGLRRLLVTPNHLDVAVDRAAWRVFGMKKIRSTKRDSGILIYVSLFERKVSVLADENAREVLGDEGIAELRDIAVEHLKEGSHGKMFIATLRRAAELLEDDLPAGDADPDELEDRILVFDPRPD